MDQIRIIGVIRSYSIRAESYSERESLNIKETYNCIIVRQGFIIYMTWNSLLARGN